MTNTIDDQINRFIGQGHVKDTLLLHQEKGQGHLKGKSCPLREKNLGVQKGDHLPHMATIKQSRDRQIHPGGVTDQGQGHIVLDRQESKLILVNLGSFPECIGMLNPFPNGSFFYSSKLKEFADNYFKFDENGRKFLKRVENSEKRNCSL